MGRYGYVYVMDVGYDNLYKIGVTRNLNSRLKALQASNPRMSVLASVEVRAPKVTEKHVHEYLDDKRVQREIFRLADWEIRGVLEYLKRFGKMSLKKRKGLKVHKVELAKIQTEPQPACPICARSMVLRRPGIKQAWSPFWGCQNYPKCTGTRHIGSDGRPLSYQSEK